MSLFQASNQSGKFDVDFEVDFSKKLIYTGGQSKSNAFLSPQWGGILIYNLQRTTPANVSSLQRMGLDMKPIMNIFLTQLKHLLGLIQVVSERSKGDKGC